MTISGELQILLKPMNDPAINTNTVVFTTVPFLKEHTQTHRHTDTHTHTHTQADRKYIKAYDPKLYEAVRTASVYGPVNPLSDKHTLIMIDMSASISPG